MQTNLNIPICIIGAGGIVNDAHLPAYNIAGYTIKGITNRNKEKAVILAQKFGIEKVYDTIEEMVAANGTDVIYDYALPASETLNVLQQLPQGATVLIQKPLGESIQEAKAIKDLVHEKQMIAGVNFQLRYAPYVNEARAIIKSGKLGTITDFEVYINVLTPWHLWGFLFSKPRMEINYHSVHYIDLIRSFLGNPQKIYARTYKHPQAKQLASVKTNIIMDYGDWVRATIHTNHNHDFGYRNQDSYIKIEGTQGAVKMGIGLLKNYPEGLPDSFEYIILKDGSEPLWQTKEIKGSWFPEAFIGTMEQMMLSKSGAIAKPDNSIDDAFDTMRCVEAAYSSSEKEGVPLADVG
ncbi:MAG: Gfo/Idh/MocA family protein [Niabella sp.]